MKINLPQKYKNSWIVLKDGKPIYLYQVEDNLIEHFKSLSGLPNAFVLPPFTLNHEKIDVSYANGEYVLENDCFDFEDSKDMQIVVTSKNSLKLQEDCFGINYDSDKKKNVLLVLPEGMGLFMVQRRLLNGVECANEKWGLIADKDFSICKVLDQSCHPDSYISKKVDYILNDNTRIIADKRYVYKDGEVQKTGLDNNNTFRQIKNTEDNQLYYC